VIFLVIAAICFGLLALGWLGDAWDEAERADAWRRNHR
jgi:hypothetical protein